MTQNYDIRDLGLQADCPLCHNRMLNSIDTRYNYDYGICSSCFITYFESIQEEVKAHERSFFANYPDKLAARDKFKVFFIEWAKSRKTEQELRIQTEKEKAAKLGPPLPPPVQPTVEPAQKTKARKK